VDAQSRELPPFVLKGRGHEGRFSLDRKLAAILKGTALTREHFPGYGPKYWYPARVVRRASGTINRLYGGRLIVIYGTSACIDASVTPRANL
jgi:hypothetical protein